MKKDIYESQDFQPMNLTEEEQPFNSSDYIYELKFDGTRTLIFVEPSKITIKNRRGIILNNTYPELLKIKNMVRGKCIFDGEIILMIDGKPSFRKLQERALLKDKFRINYFKENFPVTFVCYDILYDVKDITDLPLIKRKRHLDKYENSDIFVKSGFIPEKGIDLYNAAKRLDLEGIVAKNKNSKYQINKRSSDWVKIKNWNDEEFYICGFNEQNEGAMASIILGQLKDEKIHYVGRVTIGKRNHEFKKIKEQKEVNKNYIEEFLHDDKKYTLIQPKLQCTVEFLEKTKTGKLRQPIYKGLTIY